MNILILISILGPLTSFALGSTNKPVSEQKKIYAKEATLEFDGTDIEGEVKNPAEFYFQHRPKEKMDSLVKRRANFHREMLRDVVMTK